LEGANLVFTLRIVEKDGIEKTEVAFMLHIFFALPSAGGRMVQAKMGVEAQYQNIDGVSFMRFAGSLGPQDSYSADPAWPSAFGCMGFDIYYMAMAFELSPGAPVPTAVGFGGKAVFTSPAKTHMRYGIAGDFLISKGQKDTQGAAE
jgi:hypothetical protein